MVNNKWDLIIENRCDNIGMAIAKDKEYVEQFDAVIEALGALRGKLTSEDKTLVDHLEKCSASLMGLVERKYYLSGLRDGASLKQVIIAERDVVHVAS